MAWVSASRVFCSRSSGGAGEGVPISFIAPGRSCPLGYRYAPEDLSSEALFEAECLYIVGGLYGNLPALDKIFELAACEPRPVRIVFNGDFSWFNVDSAGFEAVNRRVMEHVALRGNVETELAGESTAAGCGCSYPESVPDAEVERSNRLMETLRDAALGFPELRRRLGALAMHAAVKVGNLRVAIVHGDCESLAGWGLSQEALADPARRLQVERWFERARVSIIASSHSCLPVMMDFHLAGGRGVAINNGAAGMPNFQGRCHGVITRIACHASQQVQPLYAALLDGVHIEALPVDYDCERWQREFLANWPLGSAAHASYYNRIAQGPSYTVYQAIRSHTESPQFQK